MLKKMDDQGLKLLLLIELKFLIMMTRLQNITVAYQLLEVIVAGNSNVLQPGHHYQKFYSKRPWLPILISHLFQHGLFRFLAATHFALGVFWLGFHFFFISSSF